MKMGDHRHSCGKHNEVQCNNLFRIRRSLRQDTATTTQVHTDTLDLPGSQFHTRGTSTPASSLLVLCDHSSQEIVVMLVKHVFLPVEARAGRTGMNGSLQGPCPLPFLRFPTAHFHSTTSPLAASALSIVHSLASSYATEFTLLTWRPFFPQDEQVSAKVTRYPEMGRFAPSQPYQHQHKQPNDRAS